MKKKNLDMELYFNILDKENSGEKLTNEEKIFIRDEENIGSIYRHIDKYVTKKLHDLSFYDELGEYYYHIVKYNNTLYMITHDDYEDKYSICKYLSKKNKNDSIDVCDAITYQTNLQRVR